MKTINIFYFCLCLVITSCAGYKAVERGNPLSQYGVKSVSIPMFYNKSSLAGAASSFTSSFITLMSSYPGLKVDTGFSKNNDAVLIGVVESQKTYTGTVVNAQQRTVSSVAPNSLGNKRNDFYVPATSRVELRVRLMLLKKPNQEELKLLRTKYASKLRGNRKIIFNEVVTVNSTFNREIFDDQAGKVNFTQNYGILHRSIDKLANQAAINFEESILYAF